MPEFEFSILRADQPAEFDQWMALVEESPSGEVFAHPSYVQLFESDSQRALCAVARWGESRVFYPFLMRRIEMRHGAGDGGRSCFDLSTPYGYGGAFAWGDEDLSQLAKKFWLRFDQWSKGSGVVSEFSRRSLFEKDLLPYFGEVETRQLNVVRELRLTLDELWMDFEPKVRKNVKRATSSGVEIEVDFGGDRLEDFLSIYLRTMDRRDAGEAYYFSRDFFEEVIRGLKGRFVFFHAVHDRKVISTELVLLSKRSVYSFLGGTDSSYFHLRPNDLLKFEIVKWAKRAGYRDFVLGGGFQESDGIYRYKKAFAPSGGMPFQIGTRVFDSTMVRQLVQFRESDSPGWKPAEGFFPPYRS